MQALPSDANLGVHSAADRELAAISEPVRERIHRQASDSSYDRDLAIPDSVLFVVVVIAVKRQIPGAFGFVILKL